MSPDQSLSINALMMPRQPITHFLEEPLINGVAVGEKTLIIGHSGIFYVLSGLDSTNECNNYYQRLRQRPELSHAGLARWCGRTCAAGLSPTRFLRSLLRPHCGNCWNKAEGGQSVLVFPFTPQDSAPGALSRGEGEEPGLVCCVELLCETGRRLEKTGHLQRAEHLAWPRPLLQSLPPHSLHCIPWLLSRLLQFSCAPSCPRTFAQTCKTFCPLQGYLLSGCSMKVPSVVRSFWSLSP